jgi:predicted HD superfamily hydrolase involved in NAD metabolism
MPSIADIRIDLMVGDHETRTQILRRLGEMLSEDRLKHSIGVAETARSLAMRFGVDPRRAYTAGITHDIARELEREKILDLVESSGRRPAPWQKRKAVLLHGYAGAALLEKWGLADRAVLGAVEDHVTGRPGMSRLSKIVFTSDYLEPGRGFLERSARQNMLKQDLDEMTLQVLEALFRYFNGREIAKPARSLYRQLVRRRGKG